jgi:hypothetical protein
LERLAAQPTEKRVKNASDGQKHVMQKLKTKYGDDYEVSTILEAISSLSSVPMPELQWTPANLCAMRTDRLYSTLA